MRREPTWRSRRELTERVPGGLNVALGPLLKGEQVLLAVLEVLHDLLLAAVEEGLDGGLAGLLLGGPATVLNVGGDVVGASIGVGDIDVHVVGTSWRIEWVEWVHSGLKRG